MENELASGFDRALKWILRAEGGYADNPLDPGGATNFGIIQRTFDRYQDEIGKPRLPVKSITDDKVKSIYLRYYWLESKACDLPWPISLLHFDGYVQHRPRDAARVLQRAVGATPDGILGPRTVAATNRAGESATGPYIYWRLRLYMQLNKHFFRGWVIRVVDLWAEAGVAPATKRRKKE